MLLSVAGAFAQDVYVGGTLNGKAAVWKNGMPTILSTEEFGTIRSVVVNNDIVYAVGQDYTGYPSVAKLWKNGVETYTFGGSMSAYALSVAVAGNDIYVAGCTSGQGKVWKNGIAEPGYTNATVINSIVVSNGKVYAAGQIQSGGYKSAVWEDGNLLYTFDAYSEVQAVMVNDNGDVYTANYKGIEHPIPVALKNDETLYELGTGTDSRYELGLYVSPTGAIYVAGSESIFSSNRTAKLWIDGVLSPLITDGFGNSLAHSVFVCNNNVYVAGQGDFDTKALLWINGEPTTLAEDGICVAYSVFVVPDSDVTETYEITVTANPPEGGQVTGGGTYEAGADVTITAVPNSEYEFINWTENDEVVSTDNSYTFIVTGDHVLVANFRCIITGIEQLQVTNNELQVFPNPTTGQLTINNEQLIIGNIEIYDVLGRLVMTVGTNNYSPLQSDTTQSGTIITIAHLNPGVYFLHVGDKTAKFIKE